MNGSKMAARQLADKTKEHIVLREEQFTNSTGQQKTRRLVKCNYCDPSKVFANFGRLQRHLTGDPNYCTGNGGVGACPSAPKTVQEEFCG